MKPKVYGHRGIPSLAPENSLKSFALLLTHNIEGVELDIHMSADGQLVVIHDFNTYNMTGIYNEVCETNYSELKKLDIGEEQSIPLLEDVFLLLKDKIHYDIEVKSPKKNRKELVKKLFELIMKHNLQQHCFISSFDPLVLLHFNRFKSNIPTAILYCKKKTLPFFLRNGLGLFFTKVDIIKPNITQLKGLHFYIYTKILKKKCYTWTVDSPEDFKLAEKAGCIGICSNFPQNFNS
ncbi:MAG: glycerophosphodiester phosphodiesterase [Spirochaetaceae bacterium]